MNMSWNEQTHVSIDDVYIAIDTIIVTELRIDAIDIYSSIGTVDKVSDETEFYVFDILSSNTNQTTYTTGPNVNKQCIGAKPSFENCWLIMPRIIISLITISL